MIKTLLFSFAFTFLTSSASIAGTPDDAKREFLIEIPNIDVSKSDELINALSALKGVEFVGYCQQMKVFCFKLDERTHLDNSKIEDFFKEENNRKYTYYIKESGTIGDVMHNCSTYVKNRNINSRTK
jgi:hypothetical protein